MGKNDVHNRDLLLGSRTIISVTTPVIHFVTQEESFDPVTAGLFDGCWLLDSYGLEENYCEIEHFLIHFLWMEWGTSNQMNHGIHLNFNHLHKRRLW